MIFESVRVIDFLKNHLDKHDKQRHGKRRLERPAVLLYNILSSATGTLPAWAHHTTTRNELYLLFKSFSAATGGGQRKQVLPARSAENELTRRHKNAANISIVGGSRGVIS
jgi:hypothetical protein